MGWLSKRREAKKEIKLARIEAKTDRVEARQETKQTAYSMGIDPNASMWQGLTGIAGSAADIVKSTSGAGAIGGIGSGNQTKRLGSDADTTSGAGESPKKNIWMYLVAGVVVLYMVFKKKR